MANVEGVIVQSVARAIDILECFSGQSAELSISEISEQMQLSKSTVYGLVNTLVIKGLLEQSAQTKRYRLGIKLFEFGSLAHSRIDLRNEARPYCEALVHKYSVTVHLAARYGGDVIYIDKIDAPGAIIVYSHLGRHAPIYCTGVGKAIMAYLSEDEFRNIFAKGDLKKYTENTITDPEELAKEVLRIRSCGYAIDNEEIEIGLRCIAAPIFNCNNLPVAAISVSGPTARIPMKQIETIAKEVKECASQISQRLGHKG